MVGSVHGKMKVGLIKIGKQSIVRGYPEIPIKDKARRVSGKFSKDKVAFFSINHKGVKTIVQVKEVNFGGGIVGLRFGLGKRKRIGSFWARQMGSEELAQHGFEKNTWCLSHRLIYSAFRGYGLGRIGFRLVEELIKQKGGKTIVMWIRQKDALNGALAVGYKVDPVQGESRLKSILGLKTDAPLPSSEKIRELLRSSPAVGDEFYQILVKRVLNNKKF